MNQIIRVFFDTHLGNGHDGLAKLASKEKIDVKNLNVGEYVVFINRDKSAFKLYATSFTVAHLRLPKGKIDLNTIAKIPTFFNGHEINYNKALKATLLEKLGAMKR